MRIQAFALLFVLLSAPILLMSQTHSMALTVPIPPPVPTLPESTAVTTVHKQVQEVSLTMSVTDHKGHFVRDIAPSDLKILDNDKEQQSLTFFESHPQLPLDVALVLDTSDSVAYRIEAERDTIRQFVKQVVHPDDTLALFGFNQQVHYMGTAAQNGKQLFRALNELKPDGETALFDAVSEAGRYLAEQIRPARRIIILVTDGEENESKSTLQQSIAEALKAESVVYAINLSEVLTTPEAARGAEILQQIAAATGGTYVKAASERGLDSAFSKLKRELANQYLIAYHPSNLEGEPFHRVRISVGSGLIVGCRSGYYVK